MTAGNDGNCGLLAAMAGLLDSPGKGFDADVESALRAADVDKATAAALACFAHAMLPLPLTVRQELHAATFEITPACVPYLSIHLFGEENYQRGVFMAALRQRYAEVGFVASDELPDHLAVVLRYAAVAGQDEARDLAQYCLLTPLTRLFGGLSPANPYRDLLVAIHAALQARFPGLVPAPLPAEQMRCHGDVAGCPGTDRARRGCGGAERSAVAAAMPGE
jgi:nitrate reductase delta subunit